MDMTVKSMIRCIAPVTCHGMRWVTVFVSTLGVLVVVVFFTWEYFLYYHSYMLDTYASKFYPCFYDSSNVSIGPYHNNTWEALIDSYERFRDPARHVIFVPYYWQGLCNRILNSVSVVLFAIATNRTLWIEWESMNHTRISSNEFGGIEGMRELFNVSFLMERPPTLEADYWPPPYCVTRIVQFGNLHALDDQKVIHMNRHDFWGTHVMKNARYKDTVFRDLDVYRGFPVLFRRLFALKKHVRPKRCSWFFQYRTVWPAPFHTAPFDEFIRCANQSGFSPSDYATSHVISDNPSAILETSSGYTRRILHQMNLPKSRLTCRGKCGDAKAMETMYELSECRRAVVSLGSSFGSCIAGLADVQDWYRVGHDGTCRRVKHGLVDANCNARDGCLNTYLANL